MKSPALLRVLLRESICIVRATDFRSRGESSNAMRAEITSLGALAEVAHEDVPAGHEITSLGGWGGASCHAT